MTIASMSGAYDGQGVMINSGRFDGMSNEVCKNFHDRLAGNGKNRPPADYLSLTGLVDFPPTLLGSAYSGNLL